MAILYALCHIIGLLLSMIGIGCWIASIKEPDPRVEGDIVLPIIYTILAIGGIVLWIFGKVNM